MVDAAISMVLKRLGEMVKDEVNLHLLADTNMKMLPGKLEAIQKVLADAEQKGMMDPKVKSWLSKLQDIAYDIDDVLDEWNHELLCEKYRGEEEENTEEEDPSNPWDKVISFLQSVCFCFKNVVESRNVVEHVFERRNIAVKVRELNGRLDSVAEQNQKEFNFLPDLTHVRHEFQPIQTSSQVDMSEARGRDNELRDLKKRLMGDRSNNDDAGSRSSVLGDAHNNTIQVISIVGFAGMGKTFLAQLAFQSVKSRFHKTAWICVSDPFDEIKVAKAILEDLTKESSNLTQFNTLLTRIESVIEGRKFLIVLDDVWLENQEKWAPFWNSLKGSGAPGSKILVTTRNTNVAKTMGSVVEDITQLGPLSDSDCWSILRPLAFRYKSPADREMLEATGRLIANKCKGLPLAVKIIGSHLSSTTTNLKEKWENVLHANIWEWEKADTGLFPILRLSYNKLDPASKRCFSYCALNPKDFEYNVVFMKCAWMAQGFVPGRDAREVEINTQKIFDNLVASSFFQDIVRKGISGCISGFKIHDIVHDFAVSLIDKEFLTLVLYETPSEPYSFQNAHYVRIDSRKSTPISFNHAENVSTLMLFRTKPPENFFNLLKRVRLLVWSECGVLPEEVGHMIHLRMLQLDSNKISELPGTICNLFELQYLWIDDCPYNGRFPQGIHKLQNLRHLRIPEDIELPQGFEKLNNLRSLGIFGANKKNKLGYLQNMRQLRDLQIIIKGLNDDDVREAENANLTNKKFLEFLALAFDHSDGEISMNVVDALQPPTNLSDLWLDGVRKIPDWMGTLNNLRELFLQRIYTIDWTHLSKLPALEKFTICYILNLKNVAHDFLGMEMAHLRAAESSTPSFPRLKELKFSKCGSWIEWEDITEEEEKNSAVSIFPCLEILKIYHCDELKVLPHRLLRKAPHLKFLRVKDCDWLKFRYNQNGKFLEKISQVFRYIE